MSGFRLAKVRLSMREHISHWHDTGHVCLCVHNVNKICESDIQHKSAIQTAYGINLNMHGCNVSLCLYLPDLVRTIMALAQHLKEASTAPMATDSQGSRVRCVMRRNSSNTCLWNMAASASRAIWIKTHKQVRERDEIRIMLPLKSNMYWYTQLEICGHRNL